ncbi:hypothetical protein AURDEDRAFT_160253 [Auricularia subglabra TFB-10046 SS5]|nr:hypothetical protein AURDEDRAFT_160253 [Auricularia subglabra TFB-10046 SS5]
MTALLAVLVSALAAASASPDGVVNSVVTPRKLGPEGNTHLDVSISDKLFSPSRGSFDQKFPQNVEVGCKSCHMRGDMSFSVGGDDLAVNYTPDENFTSSYVQAAGFDFGNTWVGLAIESFEMHVELLIQLTPADKSNDLEIHLLSEPRNISIPKISGLVAVFDPQIHGSVNVSKPVNFTYGFDIAVPSGSTFLIPIAEPEHAIAVGFNETKINRIPFQSSSQDVDMDFEFSFRAAFSLALDSEFLELDLLKDNIFVVFADVPKLDVSISQVKNVTAACAPPSPGERVFPQLTKITPRIGMDVGIEFLGKEYTPLGFTTPLNNATPVQCAEFDPNRQLLVPPGSLDKDIDPASGKNTVSSAFETPFILPLLSVLATALLA